MSNHNIGFYEDLTKLYLNYHQISSNTHLISSAVFHPALSLGQQKKMQISLILVYTDLPDIVSTNLQ